MILPCNPELQGSFFLGNGHYFGLKKAVLNSAIHDLKIVAYIRVMKIAIINGPNLNLLGVREPGIYGNQSFEQYFEELKAKYPAIEFLYYQSNVEGELINEIQRVGFSYD